jgi:hypothetical protein
VIFVYCFRVSHRVRGSSLKGRDGKDSGIIVGTGCGLGRRSGVGLSSEGVSGTADVLDAYESRIEVSHGDVLVSFGASERRL